MSRLAKYLGIIDVMDATKKDQWSKLTTVNLDSFKSTAPPIHLKRSVYTDGSKTEELAGRRYVIYYKNEEIATDSIRLAEEITFN